MKKVYFLPLLSIFLGCEHATVFNDIRSTDGSWSDIPEQFVYESKDTIVPKNIYFHIRVGNDYPYSNLFLISKLTAPNGLTTVDTLEYEMAKASGELLGDGFSDVKESKLIYKTNYTFKEGLYTFDVKQAVRKPNQEEGEKQLPGVYSIGLSIENTNKNK